MQGFRCAVMQQYISTCFYVHIVSYKFATDIDYVALYIDMSVGVRQFVVNCSLHFTLCACHILFLL